MSNPLPSKTALITGATEGIGQASAWVLAEAGHDIIVTDLDTASLAETIAGIEARGMRALGLPLNLLEEGSINSLLEKAEAGLGSIGVLVTKTGLLKTLSNYEKNNKTKKGLNFKVNKV